MRRAGWFAIFGAGAIILALYFIFPAAPPRLIPQTSFRITSFGGPGTTSRLRELERAFAHDPKDPNAIRELAHFYAVLIVNRDINEEQALAALDASKNVWILSNAAHSFQHLYNETVQYRRPNARAAAMAEKYFLRAKALDPTLDRAKILPQLDLAALERQRVAAEKETRRFEELFERHEIHYVDALAFPELPAAVATTLRKRECKIPQPYIADKPLNVIRGEFFRSGEPGWAVLCSVDGVSRILVFRSDADSSPESLAEAPDKGFLQTVGRDEVGFSRALSVARREEILANFRAYGGPAPPEPLDHHGIDDAFVGKASAIHYFHEGKWLTLQGAD